MTKQEAYNAKQRARELERRERQGIPTCLFRPMKAKSRKSCKPAYGSQEWAETYRDDLGESPDR